MRAILLIGVLALAANAARAAEPDFYPNEKFKKVGAAAVQADVQRCKNEAVQSGHGAEKGQALREGVRGGAKGAALGALAGTITGNNVGRATGAGAAVGGLATAARARKTRGENNPEFQKYVTACLEEQGYKVVGWK